MAQTGFNPSGLMGGLFAPIRKYSLWTGFVGLSVVRQLIMTGVRLRITMVRSVLARSGLHILGGPEILVVKKSRVTK